MKRIKAKLTKAGHFELFEEQMPETLKTKWLLKMISVGLCHSDVLRIREQSA